MNGYGKALLKQKNNTTSKKTKSDTKQNTGYRSKLIERISNENLFRTDFRYKMKADLQFEMKSDEQIANLDISSRFFKAMTYATPLVFSLFIFTIREYSNWNILASVVSLLSLGVTTFIAKKCHTILENTNGDKNAIQYYCFIIKILVELNVHIVTICNINDIPEFTSDYLYLFFLIGLLYNILLDIPLKQCLVFKLIHIQTILLSYAGEGDSNNLLMRYLCNLFSRKIFVLLYVISIILVISYFITKGTRELWVLYDSFKSSYHILRKNMLDDYDIPLFIVSKKQINDIIYKNLAADRFFTKVKKIQGTGTTTLKTEFKKNFFSRNETLRGIIVPKATSLKIDFKLKDIIDHLLENQFEREIEECIQNKNKKSFDFPFKVNDSSDSPKKSLNSSKMTIFEGNLNNYEWHIVTVTPCYWRGQDTLFIQIRLNDDFCNNKLIADYFSLINSEMSKLIEQVDKFCDNNSISEHQILIEKEKEKSSLTSSSSNSKISRIQSSTTNIMSIQQPTPVNEEGTVRTSKFMNNKSKILTSFSTAAKGFGGFKESPKQPKGPPVQIPIYCNSFWFHVKTSTEFLYDMYLTLQVYVSITSKKVLSPNTKLNLNDFVIYMMDYFYILTKLKNVKINYTITNPHSEILLSYPYLRVCFFNILIFIVNNTNDFSKEKIIELNIKVDKDIKEKLGGNLIVQFDINYIDENIKINLNTVGKMLHTNKETKQQQENLKVKILDIGIVTVYDITNYIYDNDLIMTSNMENNSHHVSFYLKCSTGSFFSDTYETVTFKPTRKIINEAYYNKVLTKIYKVTPSPNRVMQIKTELSKIENPAFEQKFPSVRPFIYGSKEDKMLSQEIYPQEEASLDNDLIKVMEMKMMNRELLLKVHNDSKITKSDLRKFIKVIKQPLDPNAKVNWMYGLKHELEHFTPPRFLVVGNNPYGRTHLINMIKRNILHKVDVASNITEALRQFKSVANKGFMYDLIFVDINEHTERIFLLNAIRQIESDNSYTPSIMVSVSICSEDTQDFYNYKIEKPIKSEEYHKLLQLNSNRSNYEHK